MLTDDEILEIARLGLAVEQHYGSPQDIEWARADGKTWLVQSRPITTLHPHEAKGSTGQVLVRGGWRRPPAARQDRCGCCSPPAESRS